MSRQTIQPNPTRTYGRRIAQDEFLALQRQQGGGQGDTTILAVDVLDSSATPTVEGGTTFKTVASGAPITNFLGGTPGQDLYIEAADSISITHGTPIQLAGSAPYGMTAGDTLHLKMFTDGIWTEISRSVI